ncbi:hypothetical protein DFA_02208 [Cavenderia fasciculata]|uniref:EF-hand domain-containing protein n=1 Tax=Cavenderia fasciculata TaxID=261658 RepID=F4PYF4_CACFS|nr:uncharacterized protein DFA_02208 [Cavenderia fasciculata]EGG19421.1 hypothetical protein DFA_02208 [Cavenderia fasciculata]|eukprot:XP_004357692.1 hypothetical protein DFA_02208 [Cavenderia fasciculata]
MPNSSMSSTSATSSIEPIDRALILCNRANDLLSLILSKNKSEIETETESSTKHCHQQHKEEEENDEEEKEKIQECDTIEEEEDDQDEEDFKLIQNANELFEQAVTVDNHCVDALIGLGYIAGLREQFIEAVGFLDKAEIASQGENDQRIQTLRDALKEKMEKASSSSDAPSNPEDEFEHVFQTGHNDLNVPLLIEVGISKIQVIIIFNGAVTKKFIVTLREIFDRFDITHDNTLSTEELQSYTKKILQRLLKT